MRTIFQFPDYILIKSRYNSPYWSLKTMRNYFWLRSQHWIVNIGGLLSKTCRKELGLDFSLYSENPLENSINWTMEWTCRNQAYCFISILRQQQNKNVNIHFWKGDHLLFILPMSIHTSFTLSITGEKIVFSCLWFSLRFHVQ